MEHSFQRTERTYLRLIFGIGGGILLLVLVGWAGTEFYGRFEARHLARRAAAYLGGGDGKTAALNARKALDLNPKSVEAARVLAEIAERSGDRSAIEWWRKVLDLNPGSIQDGLALVRAALRLNDLATAEKTLSSLHQTAGQTPEFHAAMGRFAEMKGDRLAAEKHWTEAIQLSHGSTGYQLQLALLRLQSDEMEKRQAALATLEQLRADPGERAPATRALIIDGVAQRTEPEQLRSLAEELQSYPEATFSDRLLYLEILRQLHDSRADQYLVNLEQSTISRPADLSALISWMSSHGNAAAALNFANSLSPESLQHWPVPLSLAESYAAEKDWTALDQLTATANWGEFDFLRKACRARALRAEQKEGAAEQQWVGATKAASSDPRMLLLLTKTVSSWGWEKETIELLWQLAEGVETRDEALRELYLCYAKAGDTSGLYRVFLRAIETAPNDLAAQNNFAQTALLLGVDLTRARKIAAELFRKEPQNAAYASTYAFSLYRQGDFAGAVRAMEQLSEAQLRQPSIAAYYAVILSANGEQAKARDYFTLASRARLLPEEQQLVAKAETAAR